MMPKEGWDSLAKIKDQARERHEKARRAAKARGRVDFPLFPYECSAAHEHEFVMQWRRDHRIDTPLATEKGWRPVRSVYDNCGIETRAL